MKIFVICSVRGMEQDYRDKLENYVYDLETKGHEVHLPHRDTDQGGTGFGICLENVAAIKSADEIHIFYSPESKGTHFDMGAAFALGKKLVVVDNVEYGEGKSFPRMLDEWALFVQ